MQALERDIDRGAYTMSEFVKVGNAADVPDGDMKTFEVAGRPVLVVNLGGEYHAMGAVCTHEEWDLSEGTLEGHKVICAGHGAVWDLRTGQAVFDEPLEDEPLYAAKVEGGELLLSTSPIKAKAGPLKKPSDSSG